CAFMDVTLVFTEIAIIYALYLTQIVPVSYIRQSLFSTYTVTATKIKTLGKFLTCDFLLKDIDK
ncbi:hypothetical protein, partial [Shewanella ulleungensis]|uniref:hypothetical protein n=1 Tax=Shewanella ulleungensis TaxID=2282699 RepID=UPI001E5BEBA5